MDPAILMGMILDNSCGQLEPREVETNGGFQQYFIETHCTGWLVHAKMVGEWGSHTWEIRSATPQDV